MSKLHLVIPDPHLVTSEPQTAVPDRHGDESEAPPAIPHPQTAVHPQLEPRSNSNWNYPRRCATNNS